MRRALMAIDENQIQTTADINTRQSGKNPVLVLLIFLNTIMISTIGFLQYSIFRMQSDEISIRDLIKTQLEERQRKSQEDEIIGIDQEQDGILFNLENFTANLAQGDGARKFVRMNTVLKFSRDSNEEEFQSRRPQIRDSIISILNSKRPEDLLKNEGKRFLKDEIKSSINSFLIDGKVLDVYYVSFQVN